MLSKLIKNRRGSRFVILQLLFVVIAFQTVSAYNNRGVVELPEGFGIRYHEFSDDSVSFAIMDRLSQSTGCKETDSINTLCLIKISDISDGALAEMMEYYCSADFINKPNSFISIYKSEADSAAMQYIYFIAWGLSYEEDSFEPFAHRLLSQKNKISDEATLNEILRIIKERYLYYRDNP